jgi:hypothetical protein
MQKLNESLMNEVLYFDKKFPYFPSQVLDFSLFHVAFCQEAIKGKNIQNKFYDSELHFRLPLRLLCDAIAYQIHLTTINICSLFRRFSPSACSDVDELNCSTAFFLGVIV